MDILRLNYAYSPIHLRYRSHIAMIYIKAIGIEIALNKQYYDRIKPQYSYH